MDPNARFEAKKKWLEMKALGRKKFIFKVGVLRFGLVMALVYLAMNLFFRIFVVGKFNFVDYFLSVEFLKQLIASLVLWLLAGWFFGRSVWRAYEKRFSDD